MIDAIAEAELRPDELTAQGRRLAIPLPNHMGEAIAIIVKHDDPEVQAAVVSTILEPGC
jgi:hypothetical protein